MKACAASCHFTNCKLKVSIAPKIIKVSKQTNRIKFLKSKLNHMKLRYRSSASVSVWNCDKMFRGNSFDESEHRNYSVKMHSISSLPACLPACRLSVQLVDEREMENESGYWKCGILLYDSNVGMRCTRYFAL